MNETILYFIRGINHYIFLLYEMLDFIELGLIAFLVIFFMAFFLLNTSIRHQIIGVVISMYELIKTKVGFYMLSILAVYYLYLLVIFEDKISVVVLIVSLYLIIVSYAKTIINMISELDNSIIDSTKEFCIPVVLLSLQQFVIMIENDDYINIYPTLLSLLIIPIYFISFVIIKTYMQYESFHIEHRLKDRVGKFDFFKVYVIILFNSSNPKESKTLLQEALFLKDFENVKSRIKKTTTNIHNFNLTPELKLQETKKKPKSKVYKFFNYIWLVNILFLTLQIYEIRFRNGTLSFFYFVSLVVLGIYLIYDLVKAKKVENQYDFVLYLIFNFTFTIVLYLFSFSLDKFRLTEIGFLIPIFIFVRVKASYYNPINFVHLPFLSDKNYFGLDP